MMQRSASGQLQTAGRTAHQDVMRAPARDLQGALHVLLACHEREFDGTSTSSLAGKLSRLLVEPIR